MRRLMAVLSLLCLALPLLCLALPARAQDLTVFAAASLTDALQDIGKVWEAGGHGKIRFNFTASSTLARQMDQGAQANVFASADLQWMDWAAAHALIMEATRRNLLGNDLVLVMPKAQVQPVRIDAALNVAALLGPNGRIATGDPASVPVGIYAQQALTRLGLWDAVAPHLARSDSVRSAPEGERLAAFESYFQYAGPYALRMIDGQLHVVHHVTHALNPNFVGTDQVRRVDLVGAGGMTLSASDRLPGTPVMRHHRLHWSRTAP